MVIKVTEDGRTTNLEGLSIGDTLDNGVRIEIVENIEIDEGLDIIKTMFLTEPALGTTVRSEYYASKEMILEGNLRIGNLVTSKTNESERRFYEKNLLNLKMTVGD